jgi:hypothetical protein
MKCSVRGFPLLTQSRHRVLQFGSVATYQKTRLSWVDPSASMAVPQLAV